MAAEMGSPGGPPRFQCPPNFCASRFAPGPPFSLRTLKEPSKQLLLIRAPANFSPESLDGHVMPLSGSQTLKVPQIDGAQKVYSIQATPGTLGNCARLIVPSGHQDRLACAPPFSGSLSIWERLGDPGANPALFPVADRQAPQIPEGLKQRFVPFGGQLKRPTLGEAAEKPPQKKKKKKRQLNVVGYMGDPEEEMDLVDRVPETPPEESTAAAEGHWEGETNHHQLKNGLEEDGEALCEQESQPSSSLLFSSQDSEQMSSENIKKKKKKKKKLKEEVLESKELLVGLGSLTQPSEPEPGLQLEFDTPEREVSSTGVEELVRHKKKKKKKKKREEEATTQEAPLSMELFPIKEEAVREPWGENGVGSPTVGTSGLVAEELVLLGHKKKKKKEKMEAPSEQAGDTMLLEPISVKEELKGWDALVSSSGEGLVQGESMDPSAEMPSQKHKKKKKKEHKKEAD